MGSVLLVERGALLRASRHECGSISGIGSSFVWEDVVDGSEGDHDQGEGGAGGVEPICPVDDQADTPIQSFVPGIVDFESNCREFTFARGQHTNPSLKKPPRSEGSSQQCQTPMAASTKSGTVDQTHATPPPETTR